MRQAIRILFAAVMAGAAGSVHAASAPTDAQIAAIVVAANQVDIDAGTLAATKATSSDVKTLASRMVTDHTAVNRQATELVTRLDVTPTPNATSASLQHDGKANLAKLRQLEGTAFDRAYVANEVKYHQAVIDALDSTLIPGAHAPELRALLVQVRPAFISHLEHARHVLARLPEGNSP